jgi:uracil phosphoribosyltransferase
VPVHLVEHPLVHDSLRRCVTRSTPSELFRRVAVRISLLLAAEATRDLPAGRRNRGDAPRPGRRPASSADVVVVPVLRAGLGMLDAVLELIPAPASGTSACSATS